MLLKMKKLKLVSIVGARPQFIKAAMLSRAIRNSNRKRSRAEIQEVLVHTGQHYDRQMSQVFFDQMDLPTPDYHLGVGSGSHGHVTGEMLMAVEKVLMKEKPQWVVVFGDTNTTLAGAFAAAKIPVPVVHVEAGLRSHNRKMPEEINRLLTDHLSALLFCPTDTAVANLKKEGIERGVHKVGDVMYDAFLAYGEMAARRKNIFRQLKIGAGRYCLATVHRQENTDDSSRLFNILEAFDELAEEGCPFILPLHPRTLKVLKTSESPLPRNSHVRLTGPLDYLDTLALEMHAKVILTDSGGIQREAFFAGIPCLTLRDETEWPETLDSGWNRLAGADSKKIIRAFRSIRTAADGRPELYGNGQAGELIIDRLKSATPFDPADWRPKYAEDQIAQFRGWLRQGR
jgi:UDP-GlcNAc3NAcA epimerase